MTKIYGSSEKSTAPLSAAQEANGFIFVSGQIHTKNGHLEGTTIEEQLDVVISNVKAILAEAGLTLADVVRVQLYLTDLAQLAALIKVYPTYFQHPLPARTAIGVAALPLGASMEMDVVAVRP